MTRRNLNACDAAWSALLTLFVPLVIALVWFGNTGGPEPVTEHPVKADARLALDYWAICASSLGLCLIGAVAAHYIHPWPTERQNDLPWPRFLPLEEKGRDPKISIGIFLVAVGGLFAGWIAALSGYSGSEIACWNSIEKPIAGGFLHSRLVALASPNYCGADSKLRFSAGEHSPQYFAPWSDLLPLLVCGLAIYFWIRWGASISRSRRGGGRRPSN